jgi:UMF1 family MFS transporter
VAALAIFVVGNVAFEMGMVFYNAFLPDIAPVGKIGRISGYGWGLGYAGGLACMAVALLVLVREQPLFGIATADGWNVRATNLLVAGWFLLFSLPMFAFVRDRRPAQKVPFRGAVEDLVTTFRHIRRFREVVKFLVARLIYNDGLVTVFAFGGIYAAGTFGMSFSDVLVFGIALNVAAGAGALIFGYIDDWIGGKRMVLISLVALSVGSLMAVLAPTRAWLWVAAMIIGLFVGPNQSASRSLMGRFVPQRHQAEFFGFFAFSGKITSFAGPIFLGIATDLFDSQRAGVATVLIFFAVGGALLLAVDERRGIEAARTEGTSAEAAGAAPA